MLFCILLLYISTTNGLYILTKICIRMVNIIEHSIELKMYHRSRAHNETETAAKAQNFIQ